MTAFSLADSTVHEPLRHDLGSELTQADHPGLQTPD
jgi:hypothetical protein